MLSDFRAWWGIGEGLVIAHASQRRTLSGMPSEHYVNHFSMLWSQMFQSPILEVNANPQLRSPRSNGLWLGHFKEYPRKVFF